MDFRLPQVIIKPTGLIMYADGDVVQLSEEIVKQLGMQLINCETHSNSVFVLNIGHKLVPDLPHYYCFSCVQEHLTSIGSLKALEGLLVNFELNEAYLSLKDYITYCDECGFHTKGSIAQSELYYPQRFSTSLVIKSNMPRRTGYAKVKCLNCGNAKNPSTSL